MKSSLRKFYDRHHDLVGRYGISVSYMTTDMVHSSQSTTRSYPHAWLITGFVTRLTRYVPLVEQELLTLPEHLSSPPVCSGVRSLVLYVCLVDHCLSLCPISFGHCVVCSSSIYGFWLPLWYLKLFLKFLKIKTASGFLYIYVVMYFKSPTYLCLRGIGL